jgi:RNA polymerase sigma-70 factor, ECF subfamily
MYDRTRTERTVRSRAERPVRSRDDVVFGQLYDLHYRPIRDFCRRRVASDLVDDVVAETFLTAWRRLEDVPTGDEALLWLYRVAYRIVGHQWRSTARRRRLEGRLQTVEHRAAAPADESLIDTDRCQLVLVAAARLGDNDAEVLRLLAWEQLPMSDIAKVLGIAPNAVKQRLHRARRNLAREYRQLESRQTSTPDASQGGAR